MSTATLTRGRHGAFAASTTFKGHTIEKAKDGTATVKNVEVFRVGSFRNSWGEENVWEQIHLDQIALHFGLLRDNGTFANVPVRANHGRDINSVIGYFEDLRVQGDRLVGDFAITEPDALAKIERGTYRSVSFEIGPYVTNEGAEFWPVAWGVAYVDIPAVEHLHSKEAKTQASFFLRSDDELENPIMPDQPPAPTPTPATFSLGNGVMESDTGKVQEFINRLVTENHAQSARLETLEAFAKTQTTKARTDFVESLVTGKKVLASQKEDLLAFATAEHMTDEAFASWSKTFEKASELPLLQEHGAGGGDGNSAPEAEARKALEEELKTARETVAFNKRGGMSETQLKRSKSYEKIARLEAELAKQS
jgi:hypothetical protein